MKRMNSILVLAVMVLSICATAFAYDYSVFITTTNTYKGGTYVTRQASGSFWKATFIDKPLGAALSTAAYLYHRGFDRCTKIESFQINNARTGLNYLSGQAVTGDQYKLVVKSTSQKGNYQFYFNP